jgi:photosystem II stability/assembly factor-like uncharacterized protein
MTTLPIGITTTISKEKILNLPKNWSSIASSGDGSIVIAGRYYPTLDICISADSGATWAKKNVSTEPTNISISSNGATMLYFSIGYNGTAVYISTDTGTNWTLRTASNDSWWGYTRGWTSITISSNGSYLAGCTNKYIYISTDSGSNWTARMTDAARQWECITSSSNGSKLAACVYNNGYIYTSTDSGITWTARMTDTTRFWYCIASSADGTTLAACVNHDTFYGYIYTSTDSGVNWTARLTDTNRLWTKIVSSSNGNILAACVGAYVYNVSNGYSLNTGNIYVSYDYGKTWIIRLTDVARPWTCIAASSDGNDLFACVYGDGTNSGYIFTTTDVGYSWKTNAGQNKESILYINSSGSTMLAVSTIRDSSSKTYLLVSTDSGTTWKQQTNVYGNWYNATSNNAGISIYNNGMNCLACDGYNSNNPTFYKSQDYGVTWTSYTTSSSALRCISSSNTGTIIVGSNSMYIYVSTDYGYTWATVRTDTNGINISSIELSANGSIIVAAGYYGYINLSTNSGVTWMNSLTDIRRYWESTKVSPDGTKIAACACGNINNRPADFLYLYGGEYIWISTDSGANWSAYMTDTLRFWSCISISADGTTIVAGDTGYRYSNTKNSLMTADGGYIWISTNSGATWTKQVAMGSRIWLSITMKTDGSQMSATAIDGNIFTTTLNAQSADIAASIQSYTSGTPNIVGTVTKLSYLFDIAIMIRTDSGNWTGIACSNNGSKLAICTNGGAIFVSSDYGTTWTANLFYGKWSSITTNASATTLIVTSQVNSVIYVSTDFGNTWLQRMTDVTSDWNSSAISNDGQKIAVSSSSYVYVSLDGGQTFTAKLTAPQSKTFWNVRTSDNGDIMVVSLFQLYGYIYVSTDSGQNWAARLVSLNGRFFAIALSNDGKTIAVTGTESNIWKSTNTGQTWTEITGTGGALGALAMGCNGGLLVSVSNGPGYIYISTDSGTTWTQKTSAGSYSWNTVVVSADGSFVGATSYAGANTVGYVYKLISNSANIGTILQPYTSGDKIYTGLYSNYALANSVNIYDNVWSSIFSGIAISYDETTIVGYIPSKIFISKNMNIIMRPLIITNSSINIGDITLSADGSKLAATNYSGYIYTSTDSGVNWTARLTDANRYWSAITSSTDGSKLAACVYNNSAGGYGYIYTSTDSGVNWTARLTTANRSWNSITSSADGSKLAACVYSTTANGYIYISTDSGVNWTARLTNANRAWRGITSSSDGSKLAACVGSTTSNGYIYTSTDSGVNWTARMTDANRNWNPITSSADGSILATSVSTTYYISLDYYVSWKTVAARNLIFSKKNKYKMFFSLDNSIIYISNDLLNTYTPITQILDNVTKFNITSISTSLDGSIQSAVYYDSTYDAGSILMSYDSGATWTARMTDTTRSWYGITSSADGSKLAACVTSSTSNGYIYTSTDSGVNWTARLTDANRYWFVITSSADGSKLAACVGSTTSNGYIYTSTDSGVNWTARLTSANRNWYAITSSADGTTLAACVSSGYIYTSTDSGVNWTARLTNANRNWYAITSSADGSKLAACVYSGSSNGYIYTSTDSGVNWTARMTDATRYWQDITSSADGLLLLANSSSVDLWYSTDSGVTWGNYDPLYNWGGNVINYIEIAKIISYNNFILITKSNIYSSVNLYGPWTTFVLNNCWSCVALSFNGSKLAAGTTGLYNGNSVGLYLSIDNNFNMVYNNLINYDIISIISSADGTILVSAYWYTSTGGYIYRSTDSGKNWSSLSNAGKRFWRSIAMSADGSKLAACESNGYIYTSSNSGGTWSIRISDTTRNWYGITSSADGSKLTACVNSITASGYIYTSTNSGLTWMARLTSANRAWSCITSSTDGSKLAACENPGYIWTSTDSGQNWVQYPVSKNWNCISSSVDGNTLVASTFGEYIYISKNGGLTWSAQIAYGMKQWLCVAISGDASKIVAGGINTTLYTITYNPMIDIGTLYQGK